MEAGEVGRRGREERVRGFGPPFFDKFTAYVDGRIWPPHFFGQVYAYAHINDKKAICANTFKAHIDTLISQGCICVNRLSSPFH
jgi:hypothetical protein